MSPSVTVGVDLIVQTREPRITMTSLFYTYMPLAGGASALAFSLNVMNPQLFRRAFGEHQSLVANCLWFNAHLGIGLYLYGRQHLRQASTYQRILFSVFGAVMFNFGSVLFWATTKALVLKSVWARSLFGLGTGVVMMMVGRDYLSYVDSKVPPVEDSKEE